MSILVTGSIAVDHIMVFPDHFKNHILPDKIHVLSVSFLVPSLSKQWGGTAANIAYNLRILGEDPILLATVGSDFGDYAEWLSEKGIALDSVRVLDDAFTAQAFITTDFDDNQIAAFHPGAMERAHEAPISGLGREFSVGIVGPNGKQAMQEHARTLKSRGVPCVVDPGQGLPLFDGDELRELLDGAAVYVVNDYEWAMTQEMTGWDEDEVASRVGALVITLGAQGSSLRRGARDAGVTMESAQALVPAIEPERIVDPTGCGDAYRAGLLYAIREGQSLERGARIGSLLGSLKIARSGPQSIELGPEQFRVRYQQEFGESL